MPYRRPGHNKQTTDFIKLPKHQILNVFLQEALLRATLVEMLSTGAQLYKKFHLKKLAIGE